MKRWYSVFFAHLFFILCTLSFAETKILSSTDVDQLHFDRSEFGNTELSFWFHLTEFEYFALDHGEDARANDPQALFALALMASGDTREMKTYNKYQKQIDSFIEDIRPSIEAAENTYDKGKKLYEAMIKVFFDLGSGGKLKGYQFEASNISALFKNGTFNCISSTMLYVILGKYFNLSIVGAEIPSHVFAILKIDDSTKVDIETTVSNGYDIKHDQQFFNQQSTLWFKIRGLEKSTYDDYLNKKIHTPLSLICHNMINQHTKPELMSVYDRHRLYETRGYLLPESRSCAISMLNAYITEFTWFLNQNDTVTLTRFYEKIRPSLTILHTVHADDNEVNSVLALARMMEYYIHLINKMTVVDSVVVDSLLEKFTNDSDQTIFKFQMIFAISTQLISLHIQKNDYRYAIALLERIKKLGDFSTYVNPWFTFVYQKAMQTAWRENKWDTVIDYSYQTLKYTTTKDNKKNVLKNLEGAYSNKANAFIREKKYAQALHVLEECADTLGSAKLCNEMSDNIVKFLKENKTQK